MNHTQGAKDAQRLSELFKHVLMYWEAKKADDAVAFAKSAIAAADATVEASSKMDMTALTASQQKLQGACQGCHMAHRERLADGSYKIKQSR
jgi:mono/diheme cytochrome c family protein